MLTFNSPAQDIIRQRFSCRTYNEAPIAAEKQAALADFIAQLPPGPFGSRPRYSLVAATHADRSSLRGLGTYGFINGATGFIIGALAESEKGLEDYGYLMEAIILFATSQNLGTCWLGGTFTKSSFAARLNLRDDETIPAVTAIGEFINPDQKRQGIISRIANARRRLPWNELFFSDTFSVPLVRERSGDFHLPLAMVQIAPSASNKQPWRIVQARGGWHFFMQRTPGYREDPLKRFLGLCDLQRLDMGIAMCHFELTAHELGLPGGWKMVETGLELPGNLTEYVASWVE